MEPFPTGPKGIQQLQESLKLWACGFGLYSIFKPSKYFTLFFFLHFKVK